jgi:ferredoxin
VNVILDVERCCGYGDCALLAPEVFSMGSAVAEVVLAEVPDELLAATREAAAACPVAAISMSPTR